jgi:hypothetical protein
MQRAFAIDTSTYARGDGIINGVADLHTAPVPGPRGEMMWRE